MLIRLNIKGLYGSWNMVNKDNILQKEITATFQTGRASSCTVIIPKKIAMKYGIVEPSHVVVEGTEKGILIWKLDV